MAINPALMLKHKKQRAEATAAVKYYFGQHAKRPTLYQVVNKKTKQPLDHPPVTLEEYARIADKTTAIIPVSA